MGVLDDFGLGSLQQHKDTAIEWATSLLLEQSRLLIDGGKAALRFARKQVATNYQVAEKTLTESVGSAVEPITTGLEEGMKVREELLKTWDFPYRAGMLFFGLSLIVGSTRGIRPKAFRLVFLGGPSVVLLTPEFHPFRSR